MTLKPKPPPAVKCAVSDFVSAEYRQGDYLVTVWSADMEPKVIAQKASRVDAESMVNQIRNALATWPGWGRVKE